jgi:hypothetical protein
MLAVIVVSAYVDIFTTEKDFLEPTASGKVLKDLEDLNSEEKIYIAEEEFLEKVSSPELYESSTKALRRRLKKAALP